MDVFVYTYFILDFVNEFKRSGCGVIRGLRFKILYFEDGLRSYIEGSEGFELFFIKVCVKVKNLDLGPK